MGCNVNKNELEQISDLRILDIIENQKKGGLCFVWSQRHTVANNHYLENYDKTKPENYVIYLDANNLYGWAMSQHLPYKDLKFSNITLDEVLETSDENDEGYILENKIN